MMSMPVLHAMLINDDHLVDGRTMIAGSIEWRGDITG